jgi:hypothetical protein
MIRHIVALALLGIVFATTGCQKSEPLSPTTPSSATADSSLGTPADGSGNKEVFVLPGNPVTITCPSGDTLVRVFDGWVQARVFEQAGNRHVELHVVRFSITFTNSEGESFVWNETGVDRVWVEDGKLMIQISGRVGAGGTNIGTIIIDLDTGETLFSAGQDVALPRVLACEALTEG